MSELFLFGLLHRHKSPFCPLAADNHFLGLALELDIEILVFPCPEVRLFRIFF